MKQDLNIRLKELDLSERFPGYFDKSIFRGFIAFIIVLGVAIWAREGFDVQYISMECPVNFEHCPNPFYLCANKPLQALSYDCDFYNSFGCEGDLCNEQTLYPGQSIGKEPPFMLRYYPHIVLGLVVSAFLMNHIMWRYNNAGKNRIKNTGWGKRT